MMMIMMRLSVAILSFMAAALILTSSSADRHDGIERALAAFRQEGSQHWAILSCAAGLRLRQPSGRITRSMLMCTPSDHRRARVVRKRGACARVEAIAKALGEKQPGDSMASLRFISRKPPM